MALSIEDAKAQAARGAALLDERYPEWRKKIDMADLDLSDPDWCVLGQAYGTYDRGTEVLFGIVCVVVTDVDFPQIVHHGFSVRDTFDFPVLQKAWIDILTE